jgi:PIN domain nuclease of toxin-antitoxin system
VIVLDTHAWLWHIAAPERLSAKVRAAIDAGEDLGICTISCWEVAMLERGGRIALDRPVREWVGRALAHERLEAIPLSSEIALDAALVPDLFPGDPADRIIYATARRLQARLATKDAPLRRFDRHTTFW